MKLPKTQYNELNRYKIYHLLKKYKELKDFKKMQEICKLAMIHNVDSYLKVSQDHCEPKSLFDLYSYFLKNYSEIQFLPFKLESEIQFYIFARVYEQCLADGMDIYFEKRLNNNSRIDICIEDVIGIEIKFNPDKNELHRLTGQMFDYSYQFPYVFGILIFDTKLITIDEYLRSKPPNSEYIVLFLNKDYKNEGFTQKKIYDSFD